MKNCERTTPSDFKIKTFKPHNEQQVIPGDKRIQGYSHEDIAWRNAAQANQEPENYSTEVYEQARKNLNNFLNNIQSLSDLQGGHFYGQQPNMNAY